MGNFPFCRLYLGTGTGPRLLHNLNLNTGIRNDEDKPPTDRLMTDFFAMHASPSSRAAIPALSAAASSGSASDSDGSVTKTEWLVGG